MKFTTSVLCKQPGYNNVFHLGPEDFQIIIKDDR